MDNFDRIYTRDHLTLYRNTKDVNGRFRGESQIGADFYKKALQLPYTVAFGKWNWGGVSNIWKYNGWRQDESVDCADLLPEYYSFRYNRGGNKQQITSFMRMENCMQ